MQERDQLARPTSLTDAVVMYVRDRVISGQYAPGQQLAEAPLAQALGISRGTIREAMRVLANLGLVSLSTHRGASVTTLTPEQANEIYTLRALLESFAARHAVERGIDAEGMAVVYERLDTLTSAAKSGDVGAMVEADMQFHLSLSALARHQLLLDHLTAIQTHSRRVLAYSDLYQPDSETVVQRHVSLLETLRAGDPEAIERAVSQHISEVGQDIVAKMRAAMPQPAEPGSLASTPESVTAPSMPVEADEEHPSASST